MEHFVIGDMLRVEADLSSLLHTGPQVSIECSQTQLLIFVLLRGVST